VLEKNVGCGERLFRVLGGTTLALVADNRYLKALGALTAAEGVVGYCVLYGLLGIDTRDDS